MRATYSMLAAVLLASMAMASAGRVASWGEALNPSFMQMHSLSKGGKGKDESNAVVAIKFKVDPVLHDKFIDEWQKVYDDTIDEKGNVMYDLKKTMGDNIYFWIYGEWESMRDYIDHYEADYTEKWRDFLRHEDIEFELFPLKQVTDDVMKVEPTVDKRKHKEDEDERDGPAHVLIQYHVPPSLHEDFMDAWEDAAKGTKDEKENTIYSLRKIATMNHHYFAYGTWESFDAYMDHFHSKHIRKLREFAAKNGVEWYLEPLRKLGEDKERRDTA